MNWNRRTRRLKIVKGSSQTIEQLFEQLCKDLPQINIDERPFNHKEGLKNCVISARSEREIAINVSNYIKSVYRFYDQLEEDKARFRKT